jgi:hypothetical protein
MTPKTAGPGPDPTNDPRKEMIEQERRRLSARLDEVARLCESSIPPPAFYGELLQRLLESLAAVAGSVWIRNAQGHLQQQFQINLQQVGLEGNEEARVSHDTLLRVAFTNGQPLHLPPRSTMGTGEEGRPAPGNPTACMLLLVPIKVNDQVIGIIEVFQGPTRPATAVPGFLQYMTMMADLASRYQRNQQAQALSGQQQLWTQLEAFARTIHGSLNPTEVAIQVANEGRRLIDCDRVCVAVRRGGEKAKIEAVSGTDIVEHRSNLIRNMRKLSQEVLNWGEKLVFQGARDDSLPPKVLNALDAYLAEAHSKLLVIVPLRDEREGDGKDKPKRQTRSALVMECFETPLDPQQTIARLEVVSKHATTALYNAVEYRRIPMRLLWMPLAKLQEGLGGKTKAIILAVVLLVSLVGAALYAFPYPLKMEFKGNALPVVRRTLYTPASGIMDKLEMLPNDVVHEGQILARMYDQNLAIKANGLIQEINLASEKVTAAQNSLRLAIGEPEKARARSEEAQQAAIVKAKTFELNELIKRTNMNRNRPGHFFLLAPALTAEERRTVDQPAWQVLTSNFQERQGSEIKPNEPVTRLGVKKGPWELEIKIPQKHIGQVLKAYKRLKTDRLQIDFLLQAETTKLCRGFLYRDRIAGEITPNKEDANDPEPFVIAYATIEHEDIPPEYRVNRERLTSNTELHGKIHCGPARAGYSLFYGVWEFLYEKVWFYLF